MSCLIKDNKFYTQNGEESRLYKDLEQKVGEVEARELFILSHTPTFQKEVKNIDTTTKVINFKGSQVFFKERKSGQIELELIQTPAQNRGKGAGRKALEEFLKYADSLVKDVRLFVSPRDRQTTTEGLMKFYESVGFRSFDKFLPEEMGRKAKKVTKKQKLVTPIANIFYENGEVKADIVINYANNNFSIAEPLTKEEILDLSTLQIQDVETSEELYEVLNDAFYKDGVFNPDVKKLQKIYTETEVRNILEDVEIQARILETIEKLRHTEEFNITPIKVDGEFSYKNLTVNIIGQYKANNPLQDKALYEEQNGGEGFVQADVIDEDGNTIEEKLIYDNAVKVVDDPNILQAIDAIIQAPEVVDTTKLEKKVAKWLLSYGLNVEALSRENYRTLAEFIRTPTEENTILLEQALGFQRTPKQPFVKISPANRTYKMLRTTKSEQQLFDELSLIKTNTPNIYHQIEKIDEQEIRDIQENQDLTVPLYELYKEYFGYGIISETQKIKEQSITDGTFMRAPNGKTTNLSEDNWLFVRTNTFKSWFGDWVNDPQNASKVVDENREPLVVFRAQKNTRVQTEERRSNTYGIYYSANKDSIKIYGDIIIESFLNIKNPLVLKDTAWNLSIIPKYLFDSYVNKGIDGAIWERKGEYYEVVAFSPNQVGSNENLVKKSTIIQNVQTNIDSSVEYLTGEFVADFASEKLKNPNDEFYQQFKITENGIELVSQDELTIAKVKSQVENYPKLADYSLVSKSLPNLKEATPKTIEIKENRRVQAVNNKESIPAPKTEVTILDDQFTEAENETAEFIKIGKDVFEQIEKGIYSKLGFQESPSYYTMNVEAPPYKLVEQKQTNPAEKTVKKLITKEQEEENFNCL
jgi:hypothetical protein